MSVEKLKNLPSDIYNLFNPDNDHVVNEDNLNCFSENVKELLRQRLRKQPESSDRPIRFSSLGKPDRQVWFDAHPEPGTKEKLLPKTYLKFLYGDIIEQLLVLLCKEAGYAVEDTQMKVEIDGVTGSLDAVVNGVVVDFKSASPFGYKKFETNTIIQDDPFGYVYQLAGYSTLVKPGQDAAWIANDKVGGDICVTPLPAVVIKHYSPSERIKHLKEVVSRDTPPPLCYQPIPDGKSGNLKLPTPCSYCVHKFRCHPGLRTFIYSTGPRYLTKVVKTPDVPEVKGSYYTD